MLPLLLGHGWTFIICIFVIISQACCTVSCFVIEEPRHRRAVESAFSSSNLKISGTFLHFWVIHFFTALFFFSSGFSQLSEDSNLQNCPWMAQTMASVYWGSAQPGEVFCFIYLMAFVANDTRVLWTGVIFPPEPWFEGFDDDGVPHSCILTHSSRTLLLLEPGMMYGNSVNFAIETAGLCLECSLSDYVHGWRVCLLCN